MMTSLHAANAFDWLSTALMMIGFAILLILAISLMIALVSSADGRSPGDVDEFHPRMVEGFEDRVRPLAS